MIQTMGQRLLVIGAGVLGVALLWASLSDTVDAQITPRTMEVTSPELDTIAGAFGASGAGINVKIAGSDPLAEVTSATLQSAATANGNGTLLTVNGYGSAILTVNCSGCSGGTLINFEASENATNYLAVRAQSLDTPRTPVTTTSTAGITHWRVPVSGWQHLRARISAYSAGTVTVTGRAVFGVTDIYTASTRPCVDESRITSVPINTASSGNVELVALASGQTVYVCGYSIVSTAAQSVQLIYGTGTACATGETDLQGPMAFGANGGITQANGGAVQFKTASANALCIELSAASQVGGHITYVQTATP